MRLMNVLGAVFVCCAVFMVHADIIDPNYHLVERCVTLDKLDDFPGIAIVGLYTGPTTEKDVRYRVSADSCLTKGYKFNTLYLFWVYEEYLQSKGIENIPFETEIPQTAKKRSSDIGEVFYGLLSSEVEPYGGTLPNTDPLEKETLVYRLSGENERITLQLVEKVSYLKDGTEKKETFLATGLKVPNTITDAHKKRSVRASMGHGYLLLSPGFSGMVSGTLINCNGRVVQRFERNFRDGATYLIPSGKIAGGIYWLQLITEKSTVNIQLSTFD